MALLEKLGVRVEGRIPCIIKANLFNEAGYESPLFM
jgi:hypothetical protein